MDEPRPHGIPDTPTTARLAEVLRMVFTLCAAREDATEEQVRELRDRLEPELRLFKLSRDPVRIYTKLAEIMPSGWRPAGQWAAGIDDPLGQVAQELLRRNVHTSGLFG